MKSDLEIRAAKSLLASKSVSGTAGKGMVVAGSSAIVLSLLAAFIPFFVVLGLGVIMLALGALMWE